MRSKEWELTKSSGQEQDIHDIERQLRNGNGYVKGFIAPEVDVVAKTMVVDGCKWTLKRNRWPKPNAKQPSKRARWQAVRQVATSWEKVWLPPHLDNLVEALFVEHEMLGGEE